MRLEYFFFFFNKKNVFLNLMCIEKNFNKVIYVGVGEWI